MLKKLIAVSPDPLKWLKQIKYVGTEETPYKIDWSVKIIDKKQYSQNMVKKIDPAYVPLFPLTQSYG